MKLSFSQSVSIVFCLLLLGSSHCATSSGSVLYRDDDTFLLAKGFAEKTENVCTSFPKEKDNQFYFKTRYSFLGKRERVFSSDAFPWIPLENAFRANRQQASILVLLKINDQLLPGTRILRTQVLVSCVESEIVFSFQEVQEQILFQNTFSDWDWISNLETKKSALANEQVLLWGNSYWKFDQAKNGFVFGKELVNYQNNSSEKPDPENKNIEKRQERKSTEERLKEIKDLKDKKLLSDEEYEKKRKQILDEI